MQKEDLTVELPQGLHGWVERMRTVKAVSSRLNLQHVYVQKTLETSLAGTLSGLVVILY